MKPKVNQLLLLITLFFSMNACSEEKYVPDPINAETPVVARTANDFLNSMGIGTHIGQGQPYKDYVTPMTYMGFRKFRDGDGLSHVNDWIAFSQQTGAKMCLLTDHNLPYTLNIARQLANAGALYAIEGPNEPNNFPFTYQGQAGGGTGTWMPVANFQKDFYIACKADSTLLSYPVLTVSIIGGETDNTGLQFLKIPTPAPIGVQLPAGTVFAVYAHCHPYVGWGNTGVYEYNMVWNTAGPANKTYGDSFYFNFGNTWRGHFLGYTNAQLTSIPKIATEIGWTTGTGGITEEQQGRLYCNLFLSFFKQNWTNTFIYVMEDENIGNWGVIRENLSYKPAANYLHNFTTILADNVDFTPDSMNYSITSQPTTVHSLLLQKSNGHFMLAVWNERVIGSDNVTVNFGATYSKVKTYDPTIGTSEIQSLSNVSSLSLTLSDHPVIIDISNQ
ncbi:MAG: glycosyl hydrolase [Salinivirgaceae bacterium]|nr:glycosyl hydrolase [Salinivirgaceae bacterium]